MKPDSPRQAAAARAGLAAARAPRTHARAILLMALCLVTPPLAAQEEHARERDERGPVLADPARRAQRVAQLRQEMDVRRQRARARARRLGLTLRSVRADGTLRELADFLDGRPLYRITHNANAAISTAADLTRSGFSVDGSGIVIGLWDGGSARAGHQEFGGRVNVLDAASPISHATHVAGTLAAAGVKSAAHGMAPAATVDSYDWNSDIAEMTARGAATPNEAGTIQISNHSYGFVSGWYRVSGGDRDWEWFGNGSSAGDLEEDFGRYNSISREQDELAHQAPYYLIFRSAGNDRSDNPAAGQDVALEPGGATVVAYDPASHPAGDGTFRGGFETISFSALAKNVVSVGSVTDAVTGGVRDTSKPTPSPFSSWGPTDDGRIKPDLVANGQGVYSATAGSNSSYGTFSGTSMACPNAAGSAALLVEHHATLFPGEAMRASTIKGLLIHSADDLGNPGPDYRHGWGLVNTEAAAALLSDHHSYPVKQRLSEGELTTASDTASRSFVWDGSSPIRATLVWTDPAGNATSVSDSRTPRLVNDLELRLLAPDDSEFLPFVMPFVGTWTEASMNSAATTGSNHTDNVEQVHIEAPAQPGTWRAVVSFSGILSGDSQQYSLLLDGASDEEPPPPPLELETVSPGSVHPADLFIDVGGNHLPADATATLTRAGEPDRPATGVELVGSVLRCRFDLADAAPGSWDLTLDHPESGSDTLPDALQVEPALWSENFDTGVSAWSSTSETGSHAWTLASDFHHSPAHAWSASAPGTKTTTSLVSPPLAIPASATGLALHFRHRFDLEADTDGGRLELSLDGGPWIAVGDPGSGSSFNKNGYTGTISGGGPPSSRSDFEGLPAWSGASGGFVETIVALEDGVFAGHELRARWRIATDGGTASPGWWVDSIALTGDPGTSYLDWRDGFFSAVQVAAGDDDPLLDFDGDGLRNFAEYALGRDPTVYSAPPAASREGELLVLEFEHPVDRSDVLGYFAEHSSDLSTWTDTPVIVVSETETTRSCRAEVPVPEGGVQYFLRLRIER